MPKAKKQTTGRNTDAEDVLSDRLNKATALVHMLAQGANTIGHDHTQMHLALEATWDLLNDAVGALGEVQDTIERLAAAAKPKDEPPADDDKPLDKKLAKDIIARVKQATKPKTAKVHWKTAAKQQREAAGTSSGETPSPSLGGAE